MRRVSRVVSAAVIGLGGVLVPTQAVPQEVRTPEQIHQPEPTVQGAVPATRPNRDQATQQLTPEDQAKRALDRRIQEARQRQCNAEWELYHQAKAEICKQPAGGIGKGGCSLGILGYEPSALCR